MRTEIIINIAVHENRIAILEDGRLVEILVERPENERMGGNIYKGVVNTVLPGMQAAFVDIGTGKSAFLHVSDVSEETADYEDLFDVEPDDEKPPPRSDKFVPIQDMLKKGQELFIQITKEPIGSKGPRATSKVSLPGRFVVLVPNDDYIGISRKITDWSEKRRLRKLTRSLKPDGFGIIVRTVAKGKGEKEIREDIRRLMRTWSRVLQDSQKAKAPTLIHREMGITSSLIRDLFSENVDRVVIDSKREYRRILSYLKSVSPQLCSRVELYAEKTPIFDAFQIEEEIGRASERRVELKAGGFLTIDHTEALVAIDVNSGRYVGHSNQEDTILKINIEAAREIARQLRLRDIGGIIVIDFIDMISPRNRKKVEDELGGLLRRDRSKTNMVPISEFGLLEMTRQRVRPSLLYTFSEPCPVCKGIGRVQGRDTTISKIERWLKRERAAKRERRFRLLVHPSLGEYLAENGGERLKLLQRSVRVRLEMEHVRDLPIDEYRMISLKSGEDVTEQFRA